MAPAPPTDYQEDVTMEETAQMQTEADTHEQQTPCLHVLPLCSVQQTARIETSSTTLASMQQRRDCVYAPYCSKQARECGGWFPGKCTEFNASKVALPESFEKEKEERRKAEKWRRSAQKREEKKKVKQQT